MPYPIFLWQIEVGSGIILLEFMEVTYGQVEAGS